MKTREPNPKCGRSLQFAGQVTISAPHSAVWAMLVDPNHAAHLTPHVQSWTEIEPNRRFEVKAGIEMGGIDVVMPIQMVWDNIVPPSQITIRTHLIWQKAVITTSTHLSLEAHEQGTMIKFTAETSPISPALAPFAHTLIGRTLRQFFSSLKSTVETATTVHAEHNLIPVGA